MSTLPSPHSSPTSKPKQSPKEPSMANLPSPRTSPMPKPKQSHKEPTMAQQLMTPEETPMEDFASPRSLSSNHAVVEPSTPDSSRFRAFSSDRILYPDHTTVRATDQPLFERPASLASSSFSPASARNQDTAGVPASSEALKPYRESYPFISEYNRDRKGYIERTMAENLSYRTAHRRLPVPKKSPSPVRDDYSNKQLSKLHLAPLKTSATKTVASPAPKTMLSSAASPTGVQKHRKHRSQPSVDTRPLTPDSKPRTRAPATKKKEGPDPDSWFTVPDFCPSVCSLDGSNVALTLPEWKSGNPLPLEGDADRNSLHEKELELASTLRLQCNVYLLCKRRIFQAKKHALQEGKEFNKTAAQNVCTIDVNKVSKMWTAFNRVGWFDESHFQKSS